MTAPVVSGRSTRRRGRDGRLGRRAESAAVDLAGRAAGQVIEDEDALGDGEVRHPGGQVRAHGPLVELAAVAQGDERHDALAEDRMGGADDGRLAISGTRLSAASTWSGLTFSPPRLMTSDARPTSVRKPSSLTLPRSPVTSQRPRMTSLVRARSRQYFFMRLGPASQRLPTSPGGSCVPSAATTRCCAPGTGRPTVPA